MWIKNIVDGIITTFDTRDPKLIAEYLDINLIIKKMPLKIKGQFQRDFLGNEYIFLSNSLAEHEERVVLAHELGHALLHTDVNINYFTSVNIVSKNKIEKEANKFAAELLIPDNLKFDEYECITVELLSSLLKVPKQYIKLKFKL